MIDFDDKPPKNGKPPKDGFIAKSAWEAIHGAMPHTTKVKTGCGRGEHWYFLHVDGVANTESQLADGVDTRGEGGYVILPPSKNNDGYYSIITQDTIAAWSQWLLDMIFALKNKRRITTNHLTTKLLAPAAAAALGTTLINPSVSSTYKTPQGAFSKCWAVMEKMDTAVQGHGGNKQSYTVAHIPFEYGLSDADAWYLYNKYNDISPLPYPHKKIKEQFEAGKKSVLLQGKFGCRIDGRKPTQPSRDNPMFYGKLGEIVWIFKDNKSEVSAVALLSHLITLIGNLVGRAPTLNIANTPHHLNFFTMIVGKSNQGKKGTALAAAKICVSGIDTSWDSLCVKSGCSTGEGIISAVRDPVWADVQIRKNGKLTQETEKQLVDQGVTDKRLVVVETEGGKILDVKNRENNTLSAVARQCFDGETLSVLTKKPYTATDAHVSIIAHITPQELKLKSALNDIYNGFFNRFLWIYSEGENCNPHGEDIPPHQLKKIKAMVSAIYEFSKNVTDIRLTDAAKALWEEKYEDLNYDREGVCGALLSRARPIVKRLAAFIALTDCKNDNGFNIFFADASKGETFTLWIDAPHLKAALAFWDCNVESVEYLFGTSRDKVNPHVKILQLIATKFNNRITASELREHSPTYRPITKAEGILDGLVTDGYCIIEENENRDKVYVFDQTPTPTPPSDTTTPTNTDDMSIGGAPTDAPTAVADTSSNVLTDTPTTN